MNNAAKNPAQTPQPGPVSHDAELLVKVMRLVGNNLIVIARQLKDSNIKDAQDIAHFAHMLHDATDKKWQQENKHFY